MKLFEHLRGFLQAFRSTRDRPSVEHSGHTLAKTLRESTHVRGGDFGGGAQEKIVVKSHERYTDSLKKK